MISRCKMITRGFVFCVSILQKRLLDGQEILAEENEGFKTSGAAAVVLSVLK